jgi:hypothetical protein
MPAAVITPFVTSVARQVADGDRLWEKRLLPIGNVQYKGRMLQFDRSYLDQLAQTFAERAYDQVPFQLATAENGHNNLPERFRGEVMGMTVRNDGLYITLGTTEDGGKILKENPGLGVSARIVEDYARSDGKTYPAAVQHVLGTLDPRIPGLGGWQQVQLASGQPDVIIDLTGETFTEESGGVMPELNAEQQARLAKLLEIPQDKLDALIAGAVAGPQLTDAEISALNGGGDDTALSDAELAELLAAAAELDGAGLLEEGEPVGAGAGAPAATGLSTEAAMALEMANYRADQNEIQMAAVRHELDEAQFLRERDQLADTAGIPPYITDLARPLLEGTGHVVDLANGRGGVDAGAVMRRVLTEFGKMAGMLDLSLEQGSGMDEPAGQQADELAARRADTVSRFRQATGI